MLLQHREGCPRKVFNCLSPFCGGLLGCCISHLLLQEARWLPVEPLGVAGVAVVAAASWCGNRTAAPSCNQLMHCCHPHRIVVMSCSRIPYAAGTAVQQLHFMSCSCNMLLALQYSSCAVQGRGCTAGRFWIACQIRGSIDSQVYICYAYICRKTRSKCSGQALA
jgi:hypothetical protein